MCLFDKKNSRRKSNAIRAPPSPHRFLSMTLRKRHKIILLFWIPFWSLALATCAVAGWMSGLVPF